jgi:hypothetical protein
MKAVWPVKGVTNTIIKTISVWFYTARDKWATEAGGLKILPAKWLRYEIKTAGAQTKESRLTKMLQVLNLNFTRLDWNLFTPTQALCKRCKGILRRITGLLTWHLFVESELIWFEWVSVPADAIRVTVPFFRRCPPLSYVMDRQLPSDLKVNP